jgi:excisionase family DNA binding protein
MTARRAPEGDGKIQWPAGHSDHALLLDNRSTDFASADLLTIAEVAKLLKISLQGVRRLQTGRHIPFLKVGGSIRFAKGDLMDYLEKCRVKAVDQ